MTCSLEHWLPFPCLIDQQVRSAISINKQKYATTQAKHQLQSNYPGLYCGACAPSQCERKVYSARSLCRHYQPYLQMKSHLQIQTCLALALNTLSLGTDLRYLDKTLAMSLLPTSSLFISNRGELCPQFSVGQGQEASKGCENLSTLVPNHPPTGKIVCR